MIRHEKAILVVLSYVIGFLTAFILYGPCTDSDINTPVPTNTVADVTVSEPTIKRTTNNDIYSYQNGQLRVFNKGEVRVLTAAHDPFSSYLPNNNEPYSTHYDMSATGLSPEGRFLYFCIQENPDENYCAGYVYEFATNVVSRLLIDQEPVTLTPELANELEWNQQGLVLEQLNSVDINTPWLLTE